MIRFFATAPELPGDTFAQMVEWEQWLDATVAKCMKHRGDGDNLVLLPELANLPVISIGSGLRMRLARKCISQTSLAMLVVGGAQAITNGFPGVMNAQAAKLEESLCIYQRIARRNRCHLVASGFFLEAGGRLVNRLWVIDPSGKIIHAYDKQKLTLGEVSLGVSVGSHDDPFFRVAGMHLAAVICFDMFDACVQATIRSGNVRALLVPSANPQKWAAPAKDSGVWQPLEWLDGSNWLMNEPAPILFVNSMLRGKYGAMEFDGQPFIRGRLGTEPCGFPTDGKDVLPSTGFFPRHKQIVYADL